MKRVFPVLLFAALAAHAGEHSYRPGVLKQIDIKDITSAIQMPNFTLPLPLGINYTFHVQSDMIVYVGNCWSQGKRNYGSEWVVNDPVEFRVEKGKLLLKRPGKGELRLALMSRLRVLPEKDGEGTMQSSVEPLPPFAIRQTVPQCH